MTQEQARAYLNQKVAKLHPQQGTIPLGKNLATLNVPPGFGYLPPEQTEILIHDIWRNPPGRPTLGAIIPSGINPVAPDAWGVIITYNNDGHVKDEDSDTLDYDKMLADMKEANVKESEKRRQDGYPAYTLTGWATRPHYDKATHKLYWALALTPESGGEATLNYNIRVLGRQGYLVMSLIGGLDQLPMIEKNAEKILSFVEFNPTQRYGDFNPETDKVAAYGMTALIVGYAAAKVGLFKGLLVAALALKKFLILAIAAIVAFFRKLFGRKKN